MEDDTGKHTPRPTKVHRAGKIDAGLPVDVAVVDRVPGGLVRRRARHGGNVAGADGHEVAFAEPGRGVTEDVVNGSWRTLAYAGEAWMDGGGKEPTLDVAVRVVLTTGLGVESVLVADKTASVEAKFVGIGDEPNISLSATSDGGVRGQHT